MVMCNENENRHSEARANAKRVVEAEADAMLELQDRTQRSLKRLEALINAKAPGTFVRRECGILAERFLGLGRSYEQWESAVRMLRDLAAGDN